MLFAAQRRLSFGISNLLAIHFFFCRIHVHARVNCAVLHKQMFRKFLHSSISEELSNRKDFFLLVINFLPLDYGSLVCSGNF